MRDRLRWVALVALPLLGAACAGTFTVGTVGSDPAGSVQATITVLAAENALLTAQVTAQVGGTAQPSAIPKPAVTPPLISASSFAPPPPASTSPFALSGTAMATPVTLQPGWSVHTRTAEGFVIGMPPGWRAIELDQRQYEASIQEYRDVSRTTWLRLQGGRAGMVSAGTLLFTIDESWDSISTGFPGMIQVLRATGFSGKSLDSVTTEYHGMIEKLPGLIQPVTFKRADLPAGPAGDMRLRADAAVPIPGGRLSDRTFMMEFFLLRGDYLYTLRLLTAADRAEVYTPIFESIGRSFRWDP